MQKGTYTALILLSGEDGLGITEALFTALSPFSVVVLDIEQIVIRDRLILTVLISLNKAHSQAIQDDLDICAEEIGVEIAISFADERSTSISDRSAQLHITVIGTELRPKAIAEIAKRISQEGANIERIFRTASSPITAIELLVTGATQNSLRTSLAQISSDQGVDIAVQAGGLMRFARKLVVMDVDSTLIQQEVIELLAAKAGVQPKVKEITDAAMRGELDFADSLKARVALLSGLTEEAIFEVRNEILLTPGARTLIKTLQKLGHTVAVVSGGFLEVIEPLLLDLGIQHYRANSLEIIDRKITGKLAASIIDRPGKAQALRDFANEVGVTLEQTIAIGDGANDLDMIAEAGLGIAFNAKPAVRAAADSSLSLPYLDSVLYLMGIAQRDFDVESD